MKASQRKVGVVLSYMSQFVHILTGLIYTPVMLRLLGQSEYGLYQLVYSVVSYLSLLSLGFGSAYMRFYSRYKAKEDEEGVAKLNGMFMLIFCSIAVICLVCGAVMIMNIRAIFGTGLTELELDLARILMTLLVINLAMTFPSTVFNCSITAHEKFIFQKLLTLIHHLLNPFLALPLLILGYGSVGMVSVTTALTFAVLISNAVYCFRKLHIRFCFKGLQISLLKEMWVFTFFIFLNQIIDQINVNVDKFLLGRISGTVAVAVYGVGGQLNTLYTSLSASVSAVFVPKVNEVVAKSNDNEELTQLFIKVGRIQFAILALILSGFIFFGQQFIALWAGPGYGESYFVAVLLMVPITVPLIQNLGIEIQRAKNMHKTRSVVYFFIALCNIVISIPLIKLWGPIGATVGTAISFILGNIAFMNWYYHNRIGLNIILFWKQIFSFVPSLILPALCGVAIMCFARCDTWLKLGIMICVYSVIYSVSIYLFGLNESEKNMVSSMLGKVMKRKKRN